MNKTVLLGLSSRGCPCTDSNVTEWLSATLISSKRGQRILRQVGNATRDDDQTVAATDAFTQTDTDEETAALGITATTASATEGT